MTAAAIISLVCIAVIAVNGLYVWQRWTPRALSPYLQLACIAPLLFSIGNLGANIFLDDPDLYWLSLWLLYTGLSGTVCMWWLVTLQIAAKQTGAPLTGKRKRLLHELPIVVLALFWLAVTSNPWHGWFIEPIPGARSDYGPIWYAQATILWALLAGTFVFALFQAKRSRFALDRTQMLFCALAPVLPTLLNALYVGTNLVPYDLTVVGLVASTSLMVVAVFRGQVYAATSVRLEDVLKQDPVPGLLADRYQRLVYANTAAEQLFGTQIDPDQGPRQIPDLLSRVLEGQNGDAVTAEQIHAHHVARYRLREQPSQWVRLDQRAISLGGEQLGTLWSLLDETERVRLDEAIQSARHVESLGLIAGGIAHDFNNLLVGVIGNAELAEFTLEQNPAETQQYLSRVKQAGYQGARLAKQLLTYAGKANLELSTVDLNRLISEITSLRRSSMASGTALHLNLDPTLPPLLGDQTQLSQVVLNLVVNAEEAVSDRGEIEISTMRQTLSAEQLLAFRVADQALPGDYLLVSVADNGPGLDEDTMSRMFDPFYSTKQMGRGLGLSTVIGVVANHKGALDARTRDAGGTRISVYIPLKQPQAEESQSLDLPESAVWMHKRVLLVEDNDDVRTVHKAMLEGFGFTVTDCASGNEAMEITNTIDLCVADLTMPGMSGEELVQALRTLQPALPVVLVSGYADIEISLKDDRSVFLAKPFSSEELRQAVATAISGTRYD